MTEVATTDQATVTVTVEEDIVVGDKIVQVRLQAVNDNDVPISSVAVGQDFVLKAFVEDLRDPQQGVFAAFIDVEFDADLVSPVGVVVHGDDFQNVKDGRLDTPGLIDEAGGIGSLSLEDPSEQLLFTLDMTADAVGAVLFTSNPADRTPLHDMLVLGRNTALLVDEISFDTLTLTVIDPGASLTNPAQRLRCEQ